ncbi:MAG: serine protease Do [Candidatus Binatota bacterium]|nr:serine protease Do [Candidatus Binatota bacterium]
MISASPAAGEDAPDPPPPLESIVCVLGDLQGATFTSSGFAVTPGDQVVTTAHGLAKVTNLRVKLHDGRVFPARLSRLGTERADVALIELVGVRLPPLELGSVDSVETGAEVSTIGCPQGFDFSLTRGVVSAIRGSDYGYPVIQTDVPVNPGSSGGPLLDRKGRVIGLVKGRVAERERIHFGLPIELVKALLDEVRKERQAYEAFNQAVLEPRISEKVPLYRRAIGLDPDLSEAHYNLGLALERLGDAAAAEKEYRETLRLGPRDESAVLNLGALLHGQARYTEAVSLYNEALGRMPSAIKVRNNLAEAYRSLGKTAEAKREFERILKEKADYAAAHYGLAVLYDDQLHDDRRAAEHYRQYLALAPEASDAQRVREWLKRTETKR